MASKTLEKKCIICFDKIKIKDITSLVCGHLYHNHCVINLIRKRTRKCPICRTRITWNVKHLKKKPL